MKIGIVGLGKIGGNLAKQALEKGIKVSGMDRQSRAELEQLGIPISSGAAAFVSSLKKRRMIFLYIPAGPAIDSMIDELLAELEAGDIILDGGNSHYGDSVRRYKKCKERGVDFIDCGTSGGLEGARHGACFMVGGEIEPVKEAEAVLLELSVPGGYVHAGPPGAGHYVKLIHNAIEFVMLQAIGEGVSLLKKAPYNLDLRTIFHNWSHGSVIRGWLIELMEQQLESRNIEDVPAYIEDTGEVNWAVEESLRREVPIPAITTAVTRLFESRDDQNYASRAIAMMRNGFGGHPFGPDVALKNERKIEKVDPIEPAA